MQFKVNSANAKIQADYGKVYVIDITGLSNPSDPVQVANHIKSVIDVIKIDMENTTNPIYTILFPAGDYPLQSSGYTQAPYSIYFYFWREIAAGTPPVYFDNKTLNVIGLTQNASAVVSNFPIQGMLLNPSNNYLIDAHIAVTNMTCNGNPNSTSFLTCSPSANYPRFINANTNGTNGIPHTSFFKFVNGSKSIAGQPDLHFNNHINIMGLEFTGPNGNNDYKFPQPPLLHPNYWSSSNTNVPSIYPAMYVEYFKSVYIDNVIVKDLLGSGLWVSDNSDESNQSYQLNDYAEIKDNLIKNTWGRNQINTPSCQGLIFLGLKNVLVQHNKIFNDLNVTNQLAGGIGMCACELDKNMLISENEVNGYEFSYWSEGNSGGISFLKNRSSGTENGFIMSNNVNVLHSIPYLVPRIENNYFTNDGLDPTYNFYSGQYNWHTQFWINSQNPINYFTQVRNNTFDIDESNYINYHVDLDNDPLYLSYTSNDARAVFYNELPFLQNSCNTFNLTNSPSNVITSYSNSLDDMGWFKFNTFNNLNNVENNCDQIQLGNTYNNVDIINGVVGGVSGICTSSATSNNCERDYTNSYNLGSGMTLYYNQYDACDLMYGTLSFNITGGTPEYKILLDNEPMGLSGLTTGAITNISQGTHTLIVYDQSIPALTGSFVFSSNVNSDFIFPTNFLTSVLIHSWLTPVTVTPPVTHLSGKTILISDLLTVDENFDFDNCTFYMPPNSKILLVAGKTITFDNCTFKASCGAMWDGIYANDPNAQIILNNCTLQDMENGVVVSNNARINATGSTFNDNVFGIVLKKNTVASTCIITNNTFQKVNGLISPRVADVKPFSGIYITDCSGISIGDITNANSGNTFQETWNGIYIENTKNTIFTNAIIQLNYNKFENITSDGTAWGASFVINPRGAGIYANNRNNANNLKVRVKGSTSTGTLNFNRCDKGVLLRKVSAEVYENKMDETRVGVYLNECTGKSFKVLNNSILNTELGIAKYGDENASGFYATGNTILILNLNAINISQLNITSPTAILSAYSSGKSNLGASYIQNNTINIPIGNAIGVSLSEGSKDFITGNIIHFTNEETSPDGIPTLVGIYSNNSNVVSIINNVVDNNFSVNGNTNFVLGNNAGIYVSANDMSRVQCNNTNFTKYGLFATGKNGSKDDFTLTSSNTMRCAKADMMFWALGNEGTFGQVGIKNDLINFRYDANNTFLANPSLNKVYRVTSCPTDFSDEIVTTNVKLQQSESSASNTNTNICKVNVVNPPQLFTQTHTCPSIPNGILGEAPSDFDLLFAEDVAEEEIVYEDFADGARQADEEMIFTWLAAHETARTANPVLDSFYLNRYAGIVGQISRLDAELAALSDSTLMADSTLWLAKIDSVRQLNNSLNSGQVFQANAKWINEQYLLALEFGIEIFNEETIEAIETLALTCPYTGGNAVYRARIIFGMIKPGSHYDDLVICNSQGMYKNGISKLQAQLNDLAEAEKRKRTEEVGVVVYPNPASTTININYFLAEQETASLSIYDLLGNKHRQLTLYNDVNTRSISLQGLASGLYVYQFKSSSNKVYTGKLIVE